MKKIIVVLFLNFIVVLFLHAQGPLPKGQKQLNAGLGFDDWGVPVFLGFDFGVHPDISLGCEFAFASEYHSSVVGFIGNGNYHFNHLLKISTDWDVYAGVNVGFYIWSWNNHYGDHLDSHGELDPGIQVGGRYYFNNNWGVNLEFRANTFPYGKIGISYRF
jgi:hypothetical protein